MEDMLKEDFMEALTEQYEYSNEDAGKMWELHGSKYCNNVYDRMSDLIMEIINEG